MLTYNNPIKTRDGMVLSVDNFVLDTRITSQKQRDGLMDLLGTLEMMGEANIDCWNRPSIGSFQNQFSIKLENGASFWVGEGLNQSETKWDRVRLDANPNKVADSGAFNRILRYLVENSLQENRHIKRFDLAIDIPLPRKDVVLVKDRRMYKERRHGKEYTQYLGQKSHPGHVKLYNKSVEAKLDYPLTRLELTLDPKVPHKKIQWPEVYVINEHQMTLDDLKINDTDRFILDAILNGFGTTKKLARKERAKIEKIMDGYVYYVTVLPKEYAKILAQVQAYVGK